MPNQALRTLAAQLRSENTVVSGHVADPADEPHLGVLAAAGSAASSDPAAYALVVESVREGYLLHYGVPRLIENADSDLRLLAGDYLYALGLERLAGLGDMGAVRQLSDLISLGAQLHADGPDESRARCGEALWLASAVAIGTGRHGDLDDAKFALRSGNEGAEAALRDAAIAIASQAGLAEPLAHASQAVNFS